MDIILYCASDKGSFWRVEVKAKHHLPPFTTLLTPFSSSPAFILNPPPPANSGDPTFLRHFREKDETRCARQTFKCLCLAQHWFANNAKTCDGRAISGWCWWISVFLTSFEILNKVWTNQIGDIHPRWETKFIFIFTRIDTKICSISFFFYNKTIHIHVKNL